MSAITLEQAQANLAALQAAQATGSFRSVSLAGRTVSYATATELLDAVTYWTRVVTDLQRKAAGRSRHGYAAASFRNPQ